MTDGVTEALEAEALDKQSLAAINAYSPGLSGAWLFQKAMSVDVNADPNANLINEYVHLSIAHALCLIVRMNERPSIAAIGSSQNSPGDITVCFD